MLLTLGLVLGLQAAPSRFQPAAPFPRLPWITIDQRWAGGSFADEACRQKNLQGRVLWIDGSANLDRVNSSSKIVALVEKIKSVGFNTIVLDVKPIVGRTLYPSQLTEQMTSWKGQSLPKGFDPVEVFRAETTRLQLSFLVSLNAFSEGHSYALRDKDKPDSQFGDSGWGYKHPELQSTVYSKKLGNGFERAGVNQDQIPLMMNPHHPEVQSRILAFVKEVVGRYHPDGLLFDDRYRYHGLDADFSSLSNEEFEKKVNKRLTWPNDVYKWSYSGEKAVGIVPGQYFDAWLAWRAETMADFTLRVRKTIQVADAHTKFGIYAGSWYGDYSKYGSNYASDGLQAGFPFLTRAYRQAGFANNLDMLITGCYYKTSTMFEAMGLGRPIGQTVEAAGDVSNRVARDQCWVYAGIQMADFKDDVNAFSRALQAAAATSQGVMVFDLSHNIDQFWPVFERAFGRDVGTPHMQSDVLESVRKKRKAWDKKGYSQTPFPIIEGSPGAGF